MPLAVYIPSQIGEGFFTDWQAPASGTTDTGKVWVWNNSTAKYEPTTSLSNFTLVTPTIASFANATHTHQNSAGGGQLDHGAALTGLADDDHTQYLLATGSRAGATSQRQSFTLGIAATAVDGDIDTNVALSVTRTYTTSAATPLITALFRNTGEVAGSDDYQNEVHIRLQAGSSADHRRYLNFAGYDGVDDWVTGVNAANNWILFDANSGAHRLWLRPTSGTGDTFINSVGSGAVVINSHDDGGSGMGTGGLKVGAGGLDATPTFLVSGNGSFISGNSTNPGRYRGYIYGSWTFTSGGTFGGMYLQPQHQPTSDSSATFVGITANPVTASGNTYNSNSVIGMQTIVTHQASATLTQAIGGNFSVQNLAAQTIGIAFASQFQLQSTAGGTMTVGYGVYIPTPSLSGGSTIGTYYGMRILDATATGSVFGLRLGITSGSNKWNLYLDGSANNHIASNVVLGSASSPTSRLDIAASDATTAQLRFRASSTIKSSPADGEMWYASGGRLTFRRSSTSEIIPSAAAQAAYTQTYSTAERTISAYTADNESGAYTGINNAQAGTVYAQLTDLNALRTAYENLRALAEDTTQALNAVIDDLQTFGIAG